jgi:similar to stage IV sporulation protein
MGVFNPLSNFLQIELTGADISNSLRVINDRNIPISNLQIIDDLTVRFAIKHCHIKEIEDIAGRKGDSIAIVSRKGIFWTLQNLKKRIVLVAGMIVWISTAIILPGRILFVEVEGCDKVPANVILEAAQNVGIGFGASRRAVRSEKMKNSLLGTVPQLQWAGVNTYGCTAVISAREREDEKQKQQFTVSQTIAASDGVITSCVVTGGTALCSEGQVVQKGEILISGYTDCGGVITAGRGYGEIFAQTRHPFVAVSPVERVLRDEIAEKQVRYSILFGKKRINFYKGSGIYDGSCVKMVSQYHLTLPGDYVLPVTVVKEKLVFYRSRRSQIDETKAETDLSHFVRNYICENGVALTIMDQQESIKKENGLIMLSGVYNCKEMIGREQGVQIGELHGKTD